MNTIALAISLILIIGLLFLVSGCALGAVFDPCESKFQDCNHACGEGILSGLCKEKCTYEYNRCGEG